MNQDKTINEESEDIELTGLLDEVLISKLDSLKTNGNLYKKYSEIYIGGIYALKTKNRTENPDWMSQSANSFREILYVLKQKEAKDLKEILQDYLNKTLTKKKGGKGWGKAEKKEEKLFKNFFYFLNSFFV